jgi:two-component system NarL family sensor kinase
VKSPTDATPSASTDPVSVEADGVAWVTVADGTATGPVGVRPPVQPRRVVLRLFLALLAALMVVAALGALAAQLLAERQSVNDAANRADVYAQAVIQPALTNELANGDPDAVAAFDVLVRDRVLGSDVVRVKLWRPDGRVLYADEPQLIGRTFLLSEDQQAALTNPQVRAEVSDLAGSENQFETGGRLLEVYRPVWAPDGRELLFELYSPYAPVAARSAELWRGFAGVTISSLLLLAALAAPIVWRLLQRAREDDRERTALLQHTVDASDAERRRIAATLHDGPVQELVATAFVAEGAAASATAAGETGVAAEVRGVAASVRGNIRVLRSLLVDIYPASLATAGLPQALRDLADTVRGRGVNVQVALAADLRDSPELAQRLVYRVSQECVRNAATHAAPCTVVLTLTAEGDTVVLDVTDDGPGFEPDSLQRRPSGHFGTQVLADLVKDAGAKLLLATAPGTGTTWRLIIPSTRLAADS